MIEKVQRHAARFVLNDYFYNSSVSNMLSESGHEKSRLCMFYKPIFGSVAFPINFVCMYFYLKY